jgi:hypothetical protein
MRQILQINEIGALMFDTEKSRVVAVYNPCTDHEEILYCHQYSNSDKRFYFTCIDPISYEESYLYNIGDDPKTHRTDETIGIPGNMCFLCDASEDNSKAFNWLQARELYEECDKEFPSLKE